MGDVVLEDAGERLVLWLLWLLLVFCRLFDDEKDDELLLLLVGVGRERIS